MKKLTAMLVMLLSVSILLCACGSKADGGDTADDSNSGEGDKILVGMVTDMAIDQAEWLQNLVAGVDEYNKSNEYNVEFKVIEATDVSEYEPKLRALAESGYSVIMGMYSAMVDPILAVAADYPDIKFGSLDGNIENIADYENVGEFGLDRLQTGFLAGCAAALMSESGLVGIAGGADDPTINAIIGGWQQGIAYINDKDGKDVQDIVAYVNSYTDPTTAKELGLTLINKGCDVIGAAAGGSGVGTAQAAAENNCYYVAWDCYYPEVFTGEQLQLGSALSYFENMTIAWVNDAVSGNFRGGERTEYSVDSGACKFDIPDDSPLTEEMRAELADIQASINSGDITIENKMLHK